MHGFKVDQRVCRFDRETQPLKVVEIDGLKITCESEDSGVRQVVPAMDLKPFVPLSPTIIHGNGLPDPRGRINKLFGT